MFQKLNLTNVKCYDDKTIDLSKPIVITGKNGVGKSSILESLIFAILGYIPGCDKKTSDMMKISKYQNGFSVKLYTDNGIIKRSLNSKKSSGSEELYFSESKESKLSGKNKDIIDKLGINTTFFDINNFLSLNSNDKSKLIYSLISTGKYDKHYLSSKLDSIIPENILNELMYAYQDKYSFEENLNKLLDYVSNNKNILSNDIKEIKAIIFQLTSLKCDTEIDINNNIDNEIEKKQSEIYKLRNDIDNIKKETLKKSEILNKYNNLKNKIEVNKDKKKDLYSEKEKLQKNIFKLQDFKFDNEINTKLTELNNTLKSLELTGIEIKNKKTNIENKIKTNNDLIKTINERNKLKKCIIDENIYCNNMEGFNSSINALNDELKSFSNIYNDILNKYNLARKDYHEIGKTKNSLLETMSDQENKIKENNIELSNIKERINNIDKEILNIDKLTSELEAYEHALKLFNNSGNIDLLEKMLSLSEKDLIDLKQKWKQQLDIKQNMILLEKNESIREDKEIKLEYYKSLEKLLKQEKFNLINSGIKPFIHLMDQLLLEIGINNKTVFIKNEKNKVDFGFIMNSKEISFEALSTGESLIFLIALMAAIYQSNDSYFKLLALDNLELLDHDNLTFIFKNIDKLNKYFDNIILIGVLDHFNLEEFSNSINIHRI